MNQMTSHRYPIGILLIAALLTAAPAATMAREDADRGAEAAHDHGDEEQSDLDRAVDELLAETCEHQVAAYRCAECRYEVGVARVPADLVSQGLIRVGEVGRHPFGGQVELTGEIRFDESRIAHLGPRLPGVVGRVMVDLGERVEAGAALLEIESAELAEAQAAYLQAAAAVRLAHGTLERQEVMREAQISSQREYLESEQALEAATIRVNAERQKLLRLGLTEGESHALEQRGIAGATGRFVLKAPFNGEVMELHAVRGERVEPGDQMMLFGDTGSLWVWVDLYEADLAPVVRAAGDALLPATIHVRAWPEAAFAGVLNFVGRTMDKTTRTVKARVAVEDPSGRLRPGMFATVRLAVGGQGSALAVPASAVLADEGRDFVFVRHEEEYFIRRPVRTGRRAIDLIEVVEGLHLGQTVAVAGAFLLKSDVLRSKMGAGCAD